MRQKNGLPYWVILALGVIAFLCEAASFGNPFPFSEQQYYLYGGGQILRHQLPYIDFWDRKPVGLFLLFAPIHLFGAYRFYALPFLAALFMWAGAFGIARIAALLSCRPFSCFLAAAVYLIASNAYPDETGGQAEQFYIPLIIVTAMLIIERWQAICTDFRSLLTTGLIAMFGIGIALEIKTSCAWDGVFLGIALLTLTFHLPHLSLKKKIFAFFICGICWIFAALAPSLLIIGYYWIDGHLYDWVWANILNHHLRSKAIGQSTTFFDYRHYYLNYAKHAFETCLIWGLPTFYFTYHFASIWLSRLRAKNIASLPRLTPLFFIFAWGWITLIASIQLRGGYAAFHYTMATIPTSVVLGAVLWEKDHLGKICLLLPLFYLTPRTILTNMTSYAEERHLAQNVGKILNQKPGCLMQLSGSYLFYDLSPASASCHVNKFLLSGMLTSPEEQFALGINREDQILQDLRKHPLYLVIDSCDERLSCPSRFKPQVEIKDGLWATNAIDPAKRFQIQNILTKDYVPVFERKHNRQGNDYVLYRLKPGIISEIVPPHRTQTK